MVATVTPRSNEVENYEKDRGKPTPSFNHYYVQTQLQFALHEACGDRYLVGGELSLSTEPTTTPDLSCLQLSPPGLVAR